jgi:fucose 4-O-acetylase-like acetyltransferase
MNFLDINTKIDNNLKQIEFYHSLYQKLQNKFSFLVIIYTFICFYFIEIIKYPFKSKLDFYDIIYIYVLLLFLVILLLSLKKTYELIKPIEVAYINQPKHFYVNTLMDYKEKLKTEDEETLNEYLKVTYLTEIEQVLENNINIYQNKNNSFYQAFKKIFSALILYVILSSVVIVQKKEEKNSLEIKNYKEIITYLKENKMAEEKQNEKPKVDPKLVIKTTPVMVKESVTLNMQTKNTGSEKALIKKILKEK